MEKIINASLTAPHLLNYGYGFGDGDEDGSGSGSGDGSGSGSGDGFGFGSGYGSGYGFGSGDGDGDGSGNGSGYGDIKVFNNKPVYNIDSIPTIIFHIRGNVAKGAILNTDFTLTLCYIVKENNLFAHGKTLKEAFNSLQDKLYSNYTIDERIDVFKQEFYNFSTKYNARDLFIWHGRLTGSCLLGRESFVKYNNIDLDLDKFTIHEFIDLVKDQYNGHIVSKLLDI